MHGFTTSLFTPIVAGSFNIHFLLFATFRGSSSLAAFSSVRWELPLPLAYEDNPVFIHPSVRPSVRKLGWNNMLPKFYITVVGHFAWGVRGCRLSRTGVGKSREPDSPSHHHCWQHSSGAVHSCSAKVGFTKVVKIFQYSTSANPGCTETYWSWHCVIPMPPLIIVSSWYDHRCTY